MEQKLMGFWIDKEYPVTRILSSEIIRITSKGNIQCKGYDGMVFTPILILPYDEGLQLKHKLDDNYLNYREQDEKLREVYSEIQQELLMSISKVAIIN